MDRVDALLHSIDAISADVYAASGMVRVGPEQRVPGHAFLPVGRGHAPGVAFPQGGVMILGQDFGNERDLDAVMAAGEETDTIPTWREIGRALTAGDIPQDACWRTNYVMGVRRGRDSNCNGRSPALRRRDLRRACRDVFAQQVRAQEPCALVVLGTHVPVALATDFPRAFGAWAGRSFASRDTADGAVMRDVDVEGVNLPLVVSILHPSLRSANLSKRRYVGYRGNEAELSLMRLVRDAVRDQVRAWGIA